MAGYKELYEICRQAWQEDWETSRNLTEKGRTYVLVVGLVFGYSIFNLGSFLALLNNHGLKSGSRWVGLLFDVKILFFVYLLSFGAALLATLFSLLIRTHIPLPTPETLDPF